MPIGESGGLTKVVEQHEEAIEAVCEAGVHVLLAGHFHRSFSGSAREMVRKAGPALVIQAGTATSVRLRAGEAQSFNLIHARRNDEIDLQVIQWNGRDFAGRSQARFTFDGEHWHSRRPVAASFPSRLRRGRVGGLSGTRARRYPHPPLPQAGGELYSST